ncbi:ADP-ribosylglycohydrolase family protein [Xylanibacter ruminicola]|nr:ADP-ribosylglycohydrolase family protein [Xylanibacter ruminicola]
MTKKVGIKIDIGTISMIGAIIGDIVGSRWEFNPTNDYNFEWLTDKNGFTDDTICTVAVADALLKGRNFGASIHDWCNRYPHPMGSYGGRFAQWVRSKNPQPYNSFGNGSAMRVSPVAYWYDEENQMLQAAEDTAKPSHNHIEGIKGAKTVALAIYTALELRKGKDKLGENDIDYILSRCTALSGYDIEINRKDVQNKFDETCQGTVPVALWIIGESTSFEDAVRKAVSLGADADTLGAIVGSIAEAIWGIPEEMKQKILTYLPEDMNCNKENEYS